MVSSRAIAVGRSPATIRSTAACLNSGLFSELGHRYRVLCGNPKVLWARQIRSITAATNPRMPVGRLNRKAIAVERASALASENVGGVSIRSSLEEGLLSSLDNRHQAHRQRSTNVFMPPSDSSSSTCHPVAAASVQNRSLRGDSSRDE